MHLILDKITTPGELPTVTRTRLLDVLYESLASCTSTVINGRAGTGKTRLATDFVHRCGRLAAWYKVDAADSDLRIFFQYLVESVRRQRPDFGHEELARLLYETTAIEDVPLLAEAFVYELLERGGPPLLIVIDDLHLVYDAEWVVPFFRRLLPPRPAPALLSRPRLTERLEHNLEHPVTLVTANAGSGKTTLVADFVRTSARSCVWYQLDHTDADPAVFLGYLTHGIKQIVKGFGEVMLSYLQQAADELAQQPERAVDVLLNEVLEKIEQQLIVVLDDYHHLGTDTAVHRVVDRLIQYIPDVMHLIIITRDMPPLSIARLRSHNSLAVIDRSELLFTDKETQELFRQVFDLELQPEQLKEYRERTHGWITALQLVRQVAQRQALTQTEDGHAIDLVDVLRQSERDIFDYFAEEVFADEPEDVKLYLPRMALLDRIETNTCHNLFPEANCRSVLPTLVRRNVFTTVAADERGEEYRLPAVNQHCFAIAAGSHGAPEYSALLFLSRRHAGLRKASGRSARTQPAF